MWSIHPGQIRPIINAFVPSEAEIDDAVRILSDAQSTGWGPISYRGKLHDRASYRYYWTVLKRARTNGFALPPQAASLL
jgi:citrate lyase subunit beta/citryl-CoA lyase